MGGPDWDLVETYPNRYASMAPTRGIVATDGMELTLGNTTVTIWETRDTRRARCRTRSRFSTTGGR